MDTRLGTTPHVIAEGVGFTEGPTAIPGGIAFVSVDLNCVFMLTKVPHLRRVATGSGPNGMTTDREGNLYVALNGGAWFGGDDEPGILRIDVDSNIEYLVTGFEAPNDICFGPDGKLYFTDPRRTPDPYDPTQVKPGRLFSCNPDGSNLELLHEGIRFINGLAFDATGTILYLAEMSTKRLLAATFDRGKLGDLREVTTLENGAPDGFALDVDGNIWLPSQRDDAVFVITPSGDTIATLSTPKGSSPTNCCFAGADMKSLFVTTSHAHSVVHMQTDVAGLELYPHR